MTSFFNGVEDKNVHVGVYTGRSAARALNRESVYSLQLVSSQPDTLVVSYILLLVFLQLESEGTNDWVDGRAARLIFQNCRWSEKIHVDGFVMIGTSDDDDDDGCIVVQ